MRGQPGETHPRQDVARIAHISSPFGWFAIDAVKSRFLPILALYPGAFFVLGSFQTSRHAFHRQKGGETRSTDHQNREKEVSCSFTSW